MGHLALRAVRRREPTERPSWRPARRATRADESTLSLHARIGSRAEFVGGSALGGMRERESERMARVAHASRHALAREAVPDIAATRISYAHRSTNRRSWFADSARTHCVHGGVRGGRALALP